MCSNDSIDSLPTEILTLIIERLDDQSYVNCLHRNEKWRSIFKFYHEEGTFKLKSNRMLSYKALFKNSLMWNYEPSFSLMKTLKMQQIEKINIYRDYIIVVNNQNVRYFDLRTFEIRRNLDIRECVDFNENDTFVIRCKQNRTKDMFACLLLIGKSNPLDYGFKSDAEVAMNVSEGVQTRHKKILIGDMNHFRIESNCCYVLNSNDILSCYTWRENQIWCPRTLGRFYVHSDHLLSAMNVFNTDVFVLNKWGQLLRYCYENRNFQEAIRIRIPRVENVYLKMVHKYCVVIGVPRNCDFRITRYRNNEGYNFYKLECPNLTCVTEHGEMLFLGFRDGRVEIYMPRAISREDIFKSRIHISDYKKGRIQPKDLIVVSIDVYEDFGVHHLFIATSSCVYHLAVTHPNEIDVWENIPEKVVYHKYPIRTACM